MGGLTFWLRAVVVLWFKFFYLLQLSFLLNPKNIVGIIFLWPIPKLIWEFNTRDFLAENWLTILMTKTWWRKTEFPKKDMLLNDLSLKWNGNLKPVFFKSLQTLNRVHMLIWFLVLSSFRTLYFKTHSLQNLWEIIENGLMAISITVHYNVFKNVKLI